MIHNSACEASLGRIEQGMVCERYSVVCVCVSVCGWVRVCGCVLGVCVCVCVCVDVDECDNALQCPGRECVNSVGSFRCVSCRPGFSHRMANAKVRAWMGE